MKANNQGNVCLYSQMSEIKKLPEWLDNLQRKSLSSEPGFGADKGKNWKMEGASRDGMCIYYKHNYSIENQHDCKSVSCASISHLEWFNYSNQTVCKLSAVSQWNKEVMMEKNKIKHIANCNYPWKHLTIPNMTDGCSCEQSSIASTVTTFTWTPVFWLLTFSILRHYYMSFS